MSHIDSFKHEIIGRFGYLPVYHPLEDIDCDFTCSRRQLVFGGGSGEHPALVLKNPLAAVARFIEAVLKDLEFDVHEEWAKIIKPYLTYKIEDIIVYYDWDIDKFHSFAEMCRSKALLNPYYDYEGNVSLETWLILGFGEFVYYAMPDLAIEIMSHLEEPHKRFHHMRYNNILLIPPNCPVYANGGNAFGCLDRLNM